MPTEDEFNTDGYSSEDDISNSDSEDKIVRTKKHPMINLPLGCYIVRGIPGHFYVDEFSTACVWGNRCSLYRNHVIRLRHLIKHKKTSIPYYMCQLNKTFAAPTQRMCKTRYAVLFQIWMFPSKSGDEASLPSASHAKTTPIYSAFVKYLGYYCMYVLVLKLGDFAKYVRYQYMSTLSHFHSGIASGCKVPAGF